jgi:hypothetical protein
VADAGVAAQLRVERGRQPVQRAGQGEPGLPFLGVEPAGFPGGVHDGPDDLKIEVIQHSDDLHREVMWRYCQLML